NHYFDLNSDWAIISRASVQITGPQAFDIEIPDVESESATFVNAGLGLKSENFTVQVYADNLTDERSIEDIFLYGDGVTDLARQPNKPRSYGVEVIYNF
ncbi:MAG: TonB-dependent receptor, partial [Thalassotalea sp.]|nr:TonB-dependent receptor [Thalassotalea sp.]